MNLTRLLADRAARHPERVALRDRVGGRDRQLDFAGLERRVAAGAAQLEAAGVGRGRTILVFQPVSIELYEILLSAFRVGARVMLVDPANGRKFLGACCDRLPPDAFFGPWKAQLLRWMVPAMRRIPRSICPGFRFPGARSWKPAGASAEIREFSSDEPALITFTSGSTGVPKAAVRSHGFLVAQHAALARSLELEEGEVDLVTLPVFVLANLASGLTSVIADTDLRRPGEADGTAIRAQCERHRVTRCAASPAFFEALLADGGPMPTIRKLFVGGAPVFPDLVDRLETALPDTSIAIVYGSTEAEPIAHLDSRDSAVERKSGARRGHGLCVGRPVEGLELRILANRWGESLAFRDEVELDACCVSPGEAGEIIVKGEHVLPGYLDGVGDEETKIRIGRVVWHRTGDAGWRDASGRLWLLGRCAARLPVWTDAPEEGPSGVWEYPFAIETALRIDFPGIRTAAMEWHGKRLLVVEAGGDSETLRDRAVLMGIEEVVILSRIPLDRRHQAKVDYPMLRQRMGSDSP